MRAIFRRDLKLAFGAGSGFGQGLGFFLIVVFLIALSLGPDTALLTQIAPAIIFVSVLLAGLLSLDRIFRADDDDGTLAQLKIGPVPMPMVVLIKALVHWLTSGLAMAAFVPIIGLALSLDSERIIDLVLALLIGTPALSLIGTIGAALTLSIRRASLIQAIVTLPLYIPTLIYGSLASHGGDKQSAALLFLGGLSLLALVLAPWVAAKTLERH